MSLPRGTVSRHLARMRQVGVVTADRQGQHVYYGIGSPKIIQAYQIMHAYSLEYLENNAELISLIQAPE